MIPPEGIESLPGLPKDDDGPVFVEPWQAQAFALAVQLSRAGYFTWSAWAQALAAELRDASAAGAPDDGSHYYEHWLAALERLTLAKSLTDPPSCRGKTDVQTMAIARRFCGPPNSGNGGYVCGMLARHISGAAEVTLKSPPPLETELTAVETEVGQWELRHGVATARGITLDLGRAERATFDEAVEAERRTPIKPHEHLLPTCFVCGPARAPRDGLRLFAGPVTRPADPDSVVFAVPWIPDPNLAAADGLVAKEFVWSALDCPTGYVWLYDHQTGGFSNMPILLGRLSARIDSRPRPGERCVVTSWQTRREGRRLMSEAALFAEDGNLLAIGRAVWIAVDRQVQLGNR